MTTFNVFQHLKALRHLSSIELLGYRDALRDMNLSVQRPKTALDGETRIIGADTVKLIDLIDTSRVKDGTYRVKGVAETAMDHHIAVNLILRERGFTAAIDTPEIEIDETLLD